MALIQDERGSQAVGFVLWIPVFVALLMIVIDATTLYITQTEMENVARDTARRMIRGGFPPAAAEAHAMNAMSLRDYPYTVRATFDDTIGAEVIIAVQAESVGIISYVGLDTLIIGTNRIGARVVMRPDPTVYYGGYN
jgi:Flp pilus assembly protein TadG